MFWDTRSMNNNSDLKQQMLPQLQEIAMQQKKKKRRNLNVILTALFQIQFGSLVGQEKTAFSGYCTPDLFGI